MENSKFYVGLDVGLHKTALCVIDEAGKIHLAREVALVNLVERLRACSYVLLDTQFVNPHLLQFGVQEITKARYLRLLEKALQVKPLPFS